MTQVTSSALSPAASHLPCASFINSLAAADGSASPMCLSTMLPTSSLVIRSHTPSLASTNALCFSFIAYSVTSTPFCALSYTRVGDYARPLCQDVANRPAHSKSWPDSRLEPHTLWTELFPVLALVLFNDAAVGQDACLLLLHRRLVVRC